MLNARPRRAVRLGKLAPFAALAAAGAVVAAILVPLAAQADTVQFSGTVHNAAGTAVSGVTVTALDFDQNAAEGTDAEGTTTTGAGGTFAFAPLPAGTYTFAFGATTTTYQQYLGGTSDLPSSERVDLTRATGGAASSMDVLLGASGSVSGKVSKLPSGALSGYTVEGYEQAADGTWSVASTAKTSSSGSYTLTGLRPGNVRLEAIDTTSAHPAYAAAFSGNATTVASAISVAVTASKTSSYNFSLGKAGSVAGTVTGAYATGVEKLGGVRVTVYRLSGASAPFDSATALASPSITTASSGAYSITGLNPGNYTLEFTPPTTATKAPASEVYGQTFLGGHDTAVGADYFTIGNATAVKGRNIELQPEAKIQGQVVDADNPIAAVPNIRVTAEYVGGNADDPSERAITTETDSNGDYELDGLGAGNYVLWVGSNVAPAGSDEDVNWVRQQVPVGTPMSAGSVATVNVNLEAKYFLGLVATSPPTIDTSGGTAVGDTLSVSSPGVWSPTADPTRFGYQWLVDGNPIAGATGSSYTLQPGNYGESINVRVSAYNFGYGTAYAIPDNGIYPIGIGTLVTPAQSIIGTPDVGQTLTADSGTWAVSGVTFSYYWEISADGSTNWQGLDADTTTQTHVVTADDLTKGSFFRVMIEAEKDGYTDVDTIAYESTAAGTSPIVLVTPPTPQVTTGPLPRLELIGGTWNPSTPDSVSVAWTIHRPNDTTDTSSNATLVASSVAGDYVTATVEAHLTGYTGTPSAPIVAQTGAAPTTTSSTVVVGTARVGSALSAPSLTWSPSAGDSTWQWQYKSGSKWKNISSGTGSTYTPLASDLGRTLRVITTYKEDGWATATSTSAATSAVAIGAAPVLGAFTSTGGEGTGNLETLVPGTWSPQPSKIVYQWEWSTTSGGPYTKISGATGLTYTVSPALSGDYLAVHASATLAGHTSASSDLSLGLITKDHLVAVKSPKVTHEGNDYSVSGGTFSPSVPAAEESAAWYATDNNDVALGSPIVTAINTPVDLSTLPAAAHWYVIVEADVSGMYSPTALPAVLVKKGDFTPSAAITLGASKVASAITAPAISWTVNSPTITYQWQYKSGSSWKSISASSDGTASSFTPSVTYFGKQLHVIETASRTNYNTRSVTSSATTVGVGDAPTPSTVIDTPAISGYNGVGSTLTAEPGSWSAKGLKFTYQWEVSPDAVHSWTTIGTGPTLVVPDSAHNLDFIGLVIAANGTGYSTASTTVITGSRTTNGQFVEKVAPAVTFKNGTYTISNGTWSPAPTGYQYYWTLYDTSTDAGSLVSTTNSYTPSVADADKKLVVSIYPILTDYDGQGATITAHTGPTVTPNAPLTLTGTAMAGQSLMINSPPWNTPSPQVYVTWYRNGVATGTFVNDSSYLLGAADVGKVISAKIDAQYSGYFDYKTTLTSATIDSATVLATTVDPAITGTAFPDETLTATTGTWNTPGLSFAFQWYSNGQVIPGATGASYLVRAADVEHEVTVGVTASAKLVEPVEVLAPALTGRYGASPQITAATPVTVSGTPTLGDTLTAVVGTWDMPTEVTYQWYYLNSSSSFVFIPGATASSYTLSPADGLAVGTQIQVQVFGSRPGHYGQEYGSVAETIHP